MAGQTPIPPGRLTPHILDGLLLDAFPMSKARVRREFTDQIQRGLRPAAALDDAGYVTLDALADEYRLQPLPDDRLIVRLNGFMRYYGGRLTS